MVKSVLGTNCGVVTFRDTRQAAWPWRVSALHWRWVWNSTTLGWMIDGAHVEGVGALDHLHANTVLHLPALPAGVPAVQPQVDELVKGHDNRANPDGKTTSRKWRKLWQLCKPWKKNKKKMYIHISYNKGWIMVILVCIILGINSVVWTMWVAVILLLQEPTDIPSRKN